MDNQRKRGGRHRRDADQQKSAQGGTAYLNNVRYRVSVVVYYHLLNTN